ncbi:cell division protein FtsQ/DivIB [Enterovibrio paralichthyis]|uniref:cell division protein FtsQ/DivIB n=1 Tax=Enterovibrio paralichthyis TaxID=2853805 RepID=UPI001C44B272|nr:cell division protein FtsQ/DivIB [Enterovibrio paralichthyis]MBV7297915.1 cell division protein FtsQ/DivIB [Enterovibrio paralichthyis]
MTNVTVDEIPAQTSMPKAHWGGLVFLVFVILALVWSLLRVLSWMGDERQLPLSQIIVQGELTHLTATEVRDSVLKLGGLQSFMLQDVDNIHGAISALPWVANVAVRKQWPDTIKVNVTEYQPQAVWNGSLLLDTEGVVFHASPEEVSNLGLVSLHGPEGSEKEVLDAWRDMRRILAPTELQIAALALNERRSWRVVTRDGIRIELGRESRDERLRRFVDLFDEIKATGRAMQYVDLRYDTGAAVGWKAPEDGEEEN